MMTQHLGMKIPAEDLVAAGLIAEIHRNVSKNKGKAVLPSTNESLAGLLGVISSHKTATGRNWKEGATTSNGQSSKSVVINE